MGVRFLPFRKSKRGVNIAGVDYSDSGGGSGDPIIDITLTETVVGKINGDDLYACLYIFTQGAYNVMIPNLTKDFCDVIDVKGYFLDSNSQQKSFGAWGQYSNGLQITFSENVASQYQLAIVYYIKKGD